MFFSQTRTLQRAATKFAFCHGPLSAHRFSIRLGRERKSGPVAQKDAATRPTKKRFRDGRRAVTFDEVVLAIALAARLSGHRRTVDFVLAPVKRRPYIARVHLIEGEILLATELKQVATKLDVSRTASMPSAFFHSCVASTKAWSNSSKICCRLPRPRSNGLPSPP